MRSRLFPVALSFALLPAAPALADDVAPDALMRRVTQEVVDSIQRDPQIRKGDARKAAAVIEAKVMPHFDFRRAARLALGAQWRLASPEQQEALVAEFRTLLVRTYSGAIASYSGQVIEYSPLRARPGDAEVTVRSRIRQRGAPAIEVEYDMERGAEGWLVYDVRIGGISLVANYRSAFADEVRNHGIEGLISTLASKNRG